MIIKHTVSALPSLTEILGEFESFGGLEPHQIDWALFRLSQRQESPEARTDKLFKVYQTCGFLNSQKANFAVQEKRDLRGNYHA